MSVQDKDTYLAASLPAMEHPSCSTTGVGFLVTDPKVPYLGREYLGKHIVSRHLDHLTQRPSLWK